MSLTPSQMHLALKVINERAMQLAESLRKTTFATDDNLDEIRDQLNRLGYLVLNGKAIAPPDSDFGIVESPKARLRFDAPVGTAEERAEAKIWPGGWVDATGYGTRYEIRKGIWHYHTGADLNLNTPKFDADRDAPFYAVASGVVKVVGQFKAWGLIVIVEHELEDGSKVWSRYAHGNLSGQVGVGETVARGEQLGRVGNAGGNYPYHLHFDIARIDLGKDPANWPGKDKVRLERDYIDPILFISERRRREIAARQ